MTKLIAELEREFLEIEMTELTSDADDEKCECEDCCGKGWNWEEQQVGERKSDVQTIKTHCDKCEGTGYELG